MVSITDKDTLQDLQQQVQQASANATPLNICGGGSKAFYGNHSEGELLDVSIHSGIIDYDPAELVITLRAGCLLKDVEALLAEHGQMLGFEPPYFSDSATIGGTVATALAGPRRAFAGGVRDFILGAKVLDGRGEVLNFGGRVIKNVAGFDVSRLMVGSMGTLGILLEVSLRVIPVFETEITLGHDHENAEAHIRWINELCGRPLPISASMWYQGRSLIRLSGSEQGVASAAEKLGGDKEASVWESLREHKHTFFEKHSHVNRISLPPTSELSFNQEQLIEWCGAQRWIGDCDIERMRERMAVRRGNLCLFRSRQREAVFQAVDDVTRALHRNLKSRFDPARIFNRNRLFDGL
jgi:glycolate oxidase FAD binding subunit